MKSLQKHYICKQFTQIKRVNVGKQVCPVARPEGATISTIRQFGAMGHRDRHAR